MKQHVDKGTDFPVRDSLASSIKVVWMLLFAVMFVRLVSLGLYPLADTTEARYGEMARLIVATGDWITPQIEEGVPFWGKPPLSFWLSAISFSVLGIHEFTARFPSWILGVLVIATTVCFGRLRGSKHQAAIAGLVLASSVMFWISSGAVMTDHSLLLGTTLSMLAYWRFAEAEGKGKGYAWGILFFVGISIGLMAKGPVALVLVGLPVGVWIVVNNKWRLLLRMPWISGSLLTALLVLPWYIMAEIKTPGFLEYFIVGEHFNRFLVSGWEGDLYGSAHSQPKGTIWLFWLASAFPWSLVLACMLLKKENRECLKGAWWGNKSYYSYLLFWALAPMVFFTMAGNILWAYVLPGLPAFAILIAEFWRLDILRQKTVTAIAGGVLALMLVATTVTSFGIGIASKSQKQLVAHYQAIKDDERLYYYSKVPFSGNFYSRATVGEIADVDGLVELLTDEKSDYVALRTSALKKLAGEISPYVIVEQEFGRYTLLREKGIQENDEYSDN